jgi:hypothetical protein
MTKLEKQKILKSKTRPSRKKAPADRYSDTAIFVGKNEEIDKLSELFGVTDYADISDILDGKMQIDD